MKFSPWLLSTNKSGWEDDSVESDVVFAHELVKFDLCFILPPFFPLRGVASSDRDVTDWRVEPNIEHFVLVVFVRHGGSPLEVTSNASADKTALEHGVGERDCV